MATINGLTAERIKQYEAKDVIGGKIVGTKLILNTREGKEIEVGDVGSSGGGGAGGAYAGLNTLGVGRAIILNSGGTVPANTPDYTIIVELATK